MTNIIEFIKSDRESQFYLSGDKVEDYACRHQSVKLNELKRVIECKKCGQVIEPFDFIYKIASKEVTLKNDSKIYKLEILELKKEIEILSKKKESLKRSIKRLL